MKKKPSKKAGSLSAHVEKALSSTRRGRPPGKDSKKKPSTATVKSNVENPFHVIDGIELFKIETGGAPPDNPRGSRYKQALISALDSLKVGEHFNIPLGSRSALSRYHKEGGYGYLFRWKTIEGNNKVIQVWRMA